MSDMPTDFYDVAHGWSKVPAPYADPDDDGVSAAGFDRFAEVGIDGSFHVVVYSGKDDRFLLRIDGLDSSWRDVLTADFASMVELVHKLTPLGVAAQIQEIQDEINKLSELLTGDDGPLQDALSTQRHRASERREKTIKP